MPALRIVTSIAARVPARIWPGAPIETSIPAASPVPVAVELTVVASTTGIVGGMSAAPPPSDASPHAVHIAATANTSLHVHRECATPTPPSVTAMQLRRGLIASGSEP